MQRSGYNLLELAIAIAVLGLFIGGVLSAISMVSSANTRNLTNHVSAINGGAYIFRLKYSALPGDVSASVAKSNSLAPRSGVAGHGDGNDKVEGCKAESPALGCETALFWRDLKASNMTGLGFEHAKDALVDGSAANFMLDTYLPAVAIGQRTSLHIFSNEAHGWNNTLYIANFSTVSERGVLTPSASLSALQAHAVDEKIDDGYPFGGRLRAMHDLSTLASTPTPETSGGCFALSKQGIYYDTNGSASSNATCQLALRVSF